MLEPIAMSSTVPPGELCERYEQLYTGLITDVMDDLGHESRTMSSALKPLDRRQTFAGLAFTAVGYENHSVDYDEQIHRFLKMVGDVPEHAVLVLEANATESAQVGELTTTALEEQGCRGVVTDGGLRDSEFVLEQGFPVHCGHRTPADSLYRWELLDWDTTAVVGGVEVSPGDVVIGDIDGVVVVPEEIAEAVLHEAEAMRSDEDAVREGIRDGMTPLEAYEEYGAF
jgi:regulator of RNase E activity RraA